MKLVNQTKCPDSILVPLIEHAAMAVGTDLEFVSVLVKQGKGKQERMGGAAFRDKSTIPFDDRLNKIRRMPRSKTRKKHGFEVTLATCIFCEFDLAGRFWSLLAHELGHIHDYQAEDNGAKLEWKYYKSDESLKMIRHDSRPQEIRADSYVENAADRMLSEEIERGDRVCAALAIWFANDKMNRNTK